MDKVKLFDKVISVGLSKFPEIQIPLKNVTCLKIIRMILNDKFYKIRQTII